MSYTQLLQPLTLDAFDFCGELTVIFVRLEDFIQGQHHLLLEWLLKVLFFSAFIHKQNRPCRFVSRDQYLIGGTRTAEGTLNSDAVKMLS